MSSIILALIILTPLLALLRKTNLITA